MLEMDKAFERGVVVEQQHEGVHVALELVARLHENTDQVPRPSTTGHVL